jgi:GT2 family glycosyltransferase
MKNIDISIIIVATNIEDLLRKCLQSVYKALEGINNEVIVVDNASSDNTPNMVAKEFPQVYLIRSKTNHGFGENNNMGMKIAKGRYILLLNSDTEIIDKKIFKEMISWMDNHPKVGLASCALLNPDRKTYQGSGGHFPTLWRVFAWMTFLDDLPGIDRLIKPYHPLHGWSPFYKGEEFFKKAHRQDWVTGAYYFMRKEAMDGVGLFDEDFFLYVEEVELSYRFVKSGWEVWYLPNWKIVHYGQVTIGSERAMVYELKNLKLFYQKHHPSWQLPILTMTLRLGAFLRIILYGLTKGMAVAKVYAKAFATI